jgi:hypothetical protein
MGKDAGHPIKILPANGKGGRRTEGEHVPRTGLIRWAYGQNDGNSPQAQSIHDSRQDAWRDTFVRAPAAGMDNNEPVSGEPMGLKRCATFLLDRIGQHKTALRCLQLNNPFERPQQMISLVDSGHFTRRRLNDRMRHPESRKRGVHTAGIVHPAHCQIASPEPLA